MKNNNETKVSVLNPLLIAMSVCFAVLKLADIISMSWWLVATPIIIIRENTVLADFFLCRYTQQIQNERRGCFLQRS